MRQKVREVSVVRGNENGGTMTARFPPIQFLAPALLLVLLLTTCSVIKSKIGTATETPAGLHPIDIRAPKFFWLIQPWKEGKLATIDRWDRYAEISFIGAKGMRIKKLCNIPRAQIDTWTFTTWPEAGIITSMSFEIVHHIAAIDDGKTKTHMPKFTRAHSAYVPALLDPHEGLVGYSYGFKMNDKYNYLYDLLYVYNYKEDRMVHKIEDKGFGICMSLRINDQYTYCSQRWVNEEVDRIGRRIFYNWRTEEIVENDLTDVLNRHRVDLLIRPCRNIHPARRYLFGYSVVDSRKYKITWDEEYSDIKVTPLSYLHPEKGKSFDDDFILSADGSWATTFVDGYHGLRDESLCKRAFFHLDERYPNGISIPILTEDYERSEGQYNRQAFVEHPVHGMCCAQEWYKEGKLYLRLYKMSEVLAEINRGLAEEQ
jgi:hypothetical protein